MIKIASQLILFFFAIFSVKNSYISNTKLWFHFNYLFKLLADANYHKILKILFYWQIFKLQLNVLKSFFYTSKSLKSKYDHFLLCNTNRCIYLPVDHLWNQQDTTDQVFYGPVYYLGLISRPSAKMLSLDQHSSVYAVSTECQFFQNTECTYHCIIMHIFKKQKEKEKQSIIKLNKQSINLT